MPMTKDVTQPTYKSQARKHNQPPPHHHDETEKVKESARGPWQDRMEPVSPAMRPDMSIYRDYPNLQLIGPPGVHGGLGYTAHGTGADPADEGTWRRPRNRSKGMFGRLHQEHGA